MLKQFEVNIHKNSLFTKGDRLLLAFSGGVDSLVLAHLLHKANYKFDLAHCNFQLRGSEANDDTQFCENFAKSIGVKCHTIYFNTSQYAKENKLSIQMAARELRYNWFDTLLENNSYKYLLTAHHANDNIETIFVNLIRGTGIKGLTGIPQSQNKIVRPLLFATKVGIIDYATNNDLKYREDSSNQEVKYKRNFIRHSIIPELKKLNPNLEETLTTSLDYFKQSHDIVKQFADLKYKSTCKIEDEKLYINIVLLLTEPQKETLLFEWLYSKHFNTSQIKQLIALLQSDIVITGKEFISSTHTLLIDRKYIVVKSNTKIVDVKHEYIINTINDVNDLPISLHFEKVSETIFSNQPNEITIQYNNTLFPLKLRRWQIGDKFKPLGMNGFKKLSDYFKDQKLSKFGKEDVWILESNHEIIWIVNYRLDDRFKITNNTQEMLKITSFHNFPH